jgi:RNA polymerase-interacting CarD/CdnL/TRCF family regulator
MDSRSTCNSAQTERFEPGTPVIYGLHGKCLVTGIENRAVGGETVAFYRLEVQKSAQSRSTRQEPAIWIPVSSALERGVRPAMNEEQAQEVMSILASREYYFPLDEPWATLHLKLERTIRLEGGFGLAKAESYLTVLRKKQMVLATEISRYAESIHRSLIRELSEALKKTPKQVEEAIQKAMRAKLKPNH